MLTINGSLGEGGGQILRTSLSLAMLTGQAIKIHNIRAGREKPGLMRQHLACVNAARDICDAEVRGNHIGSTEISFKPGTIKAGNYEFSVGTAGSTLLIFQTVLPALIKAKGVSQLKFYGGTHNMLAPSFDFIQHSFVPALAQMGVRLEMTLERHGFYPQGGGSWQATIYPTAQFMPLSLLHKGELLNQQAVATSGNIPGHVGERELAEVLQLTGWPSTAGQQQQVDCLGSGNILSLRLHYAHHTEVIEQIGKIGLSAEKVARNAVKEMRRYTQSPAVVGQYLADQLLLPMAIGAGGAFTTVPLSLHSETNCSVIEMFLGQKFQLVPIEPGCWQLSVA